MEEALSQFYQKNLSDHGSSAKGVGWKNEDAQRIRFAQLTKLISTEPFSINDLGCGVGDLVSFLQREGYQQYSYRGYDTMNEMVDRAREKFKGKENVSFYRVKEAGDMQEADYTVASGIFNLRFEFDDDSWLKEILNTIYVMNTKSDRGFAFNVLTKYSDPEYMRKELYYADPLFLFDHCKKNYSKNVALLHDYDQYDFTIIVRKKL